MYLSNLEHLPLAHVKFASRSSSGLLLQKNRLRLLRSFAIKVSSGNQIFILLPCGVVLFVTWLACSVEYFSSLIYAGLIFTPRVELCSSRRRRRRGWGGRVGGRTAESCRCVHLKLFIPFKLVSASRPAPLLVLSISRSHSPPVWNIFYLFIPHLAYKKRGKKTWRSRFINALKPSRTSARRSVISPISTASVGTAAAVCSVCRFICNPLKRAYEFIHQMQDISDLARICIANVRAHARHLNKELFINFLPAVASICMMWSHRRFRQLR